MNNVCFCFPFPFFPFFPEPPSSPSPSITTPFPPVAEPASPVSPALELGPEPFSQAEGGGALAPRIFLNDALPLTFGFSLVELAEGNSGNRLRSNFGGLDCVLETVEEPGTLYGSTTRGADATLALVDHGVVRVGCRKAGTGAGVVDEGAEGGLNRGGNRSA